MTKTRDYSIDELKTIELIECDLRKESMANGNTSVKFIEDDRFELLATMIFEDEYRNNDSINTETLHELYSILVYSVERRSNELKTLKNVRTIADTTAVGAVFGFLFYPLITTIVIIFSLVLLGSFPQIIVAVSFWIMVLFLAEFIYKRGGRDD